MQNIFILLAAVAVAFVAVPWLIEAITPSPLVEEFPKATEEEIAAAVEAAEAHFGKGDYDNEASAKAL